MEKNEYTAYSMDISAAPKKFMIPLTEQDLVTRYAVCTCSQCSITEIDIVQQE